MVQYCENEADCRRSQILEYFAESFNPDICKNSKTHCDVCWSQQPNHVQDVTSLVCKIFECVTGIEWVWSIHSLTVHGRTEGVGINTTAVMIIALIW